MALMAKIPVRAFLNYGDWMVKYFDIQKAGKKPSIDESRDEQDYELKYLEWMKRGEVYSEPYTDFGDMIEKEMSIVSSRFSENRITSE